MARARRSISLRSLETCSDTRTHSRPRQAWSAAGLLLGLLSMWIAADATRLSWQPQAHHLESLFWAVFFTSVVLPSMLVAWTEREI